MAKDCIAALLALSSALCVAIGDVLQQRSAYRFTDRSVGHIAVLLKLLRDRQWRWGVALLAVSIALQAAALAQGSVLLVQALLVFSVLFALAVNARLAHRAVTSSEWVWAGLLTAAVGLIVTIGNPHAGPSAPSAHTWLTVAVVFGPLLMGCIVVARIRGGVLAATLLAFVSGSLWGVFVVLTKQLLDRFGDRWWSAVHAPELYACVLAALGGLVWGQAAFRAGPLTASMPALEVSQPVVAAVLGVVVLGETLNTGRAGLIALAAAALVMTMAIVKLARGEAATTDDGQRQADQGRQQLTAPAAQAARCAAPAQSRRPAKSPLAANGVRASVSPCEPGKTGVGCGASDCDRQPHRCQLATAAV